MKRRWTTPVSASLIIILLLSCSDAEETVETGEQRGRSIEPEQQAVIYDGEEEVTTVNVALARTASERSTGLMDVHEMPFDTGMLFLFETEEPLSFWMANTPLSLDIIFMDRNREIVRVRTNTTPYSERQVTSDVPAQYVLEVNAGFAREYDIREGMRVEW